MKKTDYSKPLTPEDRLPEPDAIFFDWDGTLADGLPLIKSGYDYMTARLGLPEFTLDDVKGFMRRSSRDLFPQLFGNRAEEAKNLFYEFVRGRYLSFFSPIDGAEALLQSMRDSEIPAALISNKNHDLLVSELQEHGWDLYFSCIVGAGKAERDKPEADPLVMARDMAGLSDAHVIWYVGDSETDMVAALAAGMVPVFVESGLRKLSDCHNIGIFPYSVENIKDIRL
ncbi:MAG: HAD family hydrolase [Pseudobdellovibrionaceae bacterium]|nr:HAD family hydrolase [Pseudobdellovibrionaceae bacterium]